MEALAESYESDNRVLIKQNLDDIGQPFTCESWAGYCGAESYDIINDGDDYFLFNLFSLDDYFHSIAIIDHNMVFRHYFECNTIGLNGLTEIVEEILSEINVVLGDLNDDQTMDILDIIISINIIFGIEGYNTFADLNSDDVVDIFDLLLMVQLIMQ